MIDGRLHLAYRTGIRRRLEEMDIFLFIASQTSLVRPYIKDPELRRARERHAKDEVEIVTVKLEPCASDEDPFLGKIQRLAPKFRSIAQAPLRSAAWDQVRKDLLPVIKRVRDRKTNQPVSALEREPSGRRASNKNVNRYEKKYSKMRKTQRRHSQSPA